MTLRNALRSAIVFFLIFPFLILLSQFRVDGFLNGSIDGAELFWAFKNTFAQAFISAIFSLVLGLWTSLGLLSLREKRHRHWRFLLDILCLLPNFLPPLFMLLATLNAIEPFPFGIWGIALIHTFINFGLVAVLLAQIIESKLGGMVEQAYVEGASRWQFFRQVFFPLLKKDLALMGLFVFVICFGSFSVPLVVGGGHGTTIEVLIYEKIRLASEWGDAVILAFLQSAFIFGLAFVVQKSRVVRVDRWAKLKLIQMPSGIFVVGFISAVYLFGYAQSFSSGLAMLSTFYDIQSALFWGFLGTLAMGLLVGLLCYLGLLLMAYCWPKAWFEKFLNGYVAPSTSLACFALLILGPNEGWMPFVKIPLALTILSLNTLFRMGWDNELESLQSQVTVAHTMGASRNQIFIEILLPQITRRAGLLAGLASVWACGDFAVSRILAHRDITLGMMTETLMSSYRLHQATVLSSLVILASLICFIFFIGGSRVLRRKLTP